MKRRGLLVGGAALLLSGCTAVPLPRGTGVPRQTPLSPTPPPTGMAVPTSPPAPAAPPPDTRSGADLNVPYSVHGIVVVSPNHRVSAAFVPVWSTHRLGLHPEAAAGFTRLAAAARADGLALSIRSAYRSFAVQKDSFDRAMRTYPEITARRYFAEPGASEHQTGLALDAWDGRHRGSAFARTPQAAWLATHAFEHGFIVRYPDGKDAITGYAWESWHLRWVGVEVAAAFGPDGSLTLEECLGLA